MAGPFLRVVKEGAIAAEVNAAIIAQKDKANGLAPLDGSGRVPAANLRPPADTGAIANLGGVDSFRKGLLAERPASGQPGEFFFSTDVGRLSEGTGAGWATRAVSRFDDLTQKNHKAQHEPGGADALAGLTDASFAAANKDGLAAVPSLRTLGTGGQQAAAGNDGRLSDSRSPTAHASSHSSGGTDAITHNNLAGLATGDPHTQYQIRTERNAANGYAGLGASSTVAPANLATGTRDGTKYLRDDGTWQAVSGGTGFVSPSLIEGLALRWDGANALTLESGVAYVPGLAAKVREVASPVSKTALSFAASTWYFVYLFENAGNPDYELVAYTPGTPNVPVLYRGTARHKPGDQTRRFVGTVLSDASATPGMHNFRHDPGEDFYRWLVTTNAGIFEPLAGGTATVNTNVSAAAAVPPTAWRAWSKVFTNASASVNLGLPNLAADLVLHNINARLEAKLELDSSQAFRYRNSAASGSTFVDILGYWSAR